MATAPLDEKLRCGAGGSTASGKASRGASSQLARRAAVEALAASRNVDGNEDDDDEEAAADASMADAIAAA